MCVKIICLQRTSKTRCVSCICYVCLENQYLESIFKCTYQMPFNLQLKICVAMIGTAFTNLYDYRSTCSFKNTLYKITI